MANQGPSILHTMTPRAATPPPFMSFAARNVVVPEFSEFRPKDVKAHHNHKEAVTQVAWNADGRKLASCGHEKTPRIWMPENSLEPRSTTVLIGSHSNNVTTVAWHPKHPDLIWSSSEIDRKMHFWDSRVTKQPIQTITSPSPIQKMKFTPDGSSLVMLDDASTFYQMFPQHADEPQKSSWNVQDDTSKVVTDITDFQFNHASDLVFLSSKKGTISMMEYPSMNIIETFDAHVGACNALDFDPKGQYLATGGSDAVINIFDMVEGTISHTLSIIDLPVHVLAYSWDGEYLATSSASPISADKNEKPRWQVVIGSSVTSRILYKGVEQPGPPGCLAWHPTKHIFASCGDHSSATRGGWISCFGIS